VTAQSEDGDMVAVHATAVGVTATGQDHRNEYHFLFRMEGGRIAEGWEFLDTAFIYARNGQR
jgi:ketosteroid isomerase-like protein